jgi:hypothetical protein
LFGTRKAGLVVGHRLVRMKARMTLKDEDAPITHTLRRPAWRLRFQLG